VLMHRNPQFLIHTLLQIFLIEMYHPREISDKKFFTAVAVRTRARARPRVLRIPQCTLLSRSYKFLLAARN
jgi:hypothetical protein